ncbi:hypothetical protein [Taibaiella chishuiensis]|uniref:Uncharacterized protein n=1 Tax=Taibaiella chishuiensis TaxID=1434707 RepID=A0A2P8DD71_9BACT|nr:hypothetical protein [Taibaiella chishuiensis]PSK95166.1 hypothetical protein B0I18_1011331 [Taibaiella chishuiensis]
MKKLCLSLAFVAGFAAVSSANTLRILNLSSCPFFVGTIGNGYVYATPGFNNLYSDPSAVPSSTAPATAIFSEASVQRDYFPDGFGVSIAQPYRSSTDINDYPACHGGTAYDVYWNYNPITLDAVLLIM